MEEEERNGEGKGGEEDVCVEVVCLWLRRGVEGRGMVKGGE